MSKTTLAVVTAAAVSALSLALILGRWYVLGDEIDGTPGTAVWRVAVEVEGGMTAPDAAPAGGRYSRPQPLVESEHPEIAALASRLAGTETHPEDRAQHLLEYVTRLPAGDAAGALECLSAESGTDAGKARLLVACCR